METEPTLSLQPPGPLHLKTPTGRDQGRFTTVAERGAIERARREGYYVLYRVDADRLHALTGSLPSYIYSPPAGEHGAAGR